jgi:MFS family permease
LPVGIIALALGAFLIPSSKDPNPRAIDMKGFILSIAMVGLLVFTVIEGPHQGWMSFRTLASFAVTILLFALFILCELKTEEPLLDVRVFRNPRISAATGSISAAFFVLFGFTFLVTQYFQFIRGYSTLSAGLHTLPFAFGAGITAPIAARLALKFGTKRVVAHGLLNMSIGLVIMGFCGADAPYWGPVVIAMLFLASGLGLVTSPATDAVMGSLPAERAGIGSAINDVGREVGGTLGVAISGSVFASLYGPKIVELISNFGLPEDVVAIAKQSAGAGFAVAEMAPTPEATEAIRGAVSDAFMHGFHAASFTGAGVALVGSLCAWKFLPARNRSI